MFFKETGLEIKAYFTFYIAFKMIRQALMKTLKYNRDV